MLHVYRYFLESDDRLAEIGTLYASGGMLTGEVKKELITLLTVCVCMYVYVVYV